MGKHYERHPDKEKHVSRGGTCASQGGSNKRMRLGTEEEEDRASLGFISCSSSSSGSDASQRNVKRPRHELDPKGPLMRAIRPVLSADKYMKRILAKAALKFYEKSQDLEFEIVETLYFQSSLLTPPGSKSGGVWCHSSFIAKPKNSDSSPEYFFAEFLRSERSSKFHVKYCCTFEPSDNPGFNHNCMFCPPLQKFHPADGYYAGSEGWRVVEYSWV